MIVRSPKAKKKPYERYINERWYRVRKGLFFTNNPNPRTAHNQLKAWLFCKTTRVIRREWRHDGNVWRYR